MADDDKYSIWRGLQGGLGSIGIPFPEPPPLLPSDASSRELPGLTSHSVHTVAIDPRTGRPLSAGEQKIIEAITGGSDPTGPGPEGYGQLQGLVGDPIYSGIPDDPGMRNNPGADTGRYATGARLLPSSPNSDLPAGAGVDPSLAFAGQPGANYGTGSRMGVDGSPGEQAIVAALTKQPGSGFGMGWGSQFRREDYLGNGGTPTVQMPSEPNGMPIDNSVPIRADGNAPQRPVAAPPAAAAPSGPVSPVGALHAALMAKQTMQNPVAAAAFAKGRTSYVNPNTGALMPTVAMNGQQRRTYGDP